MESGSKVNLSGRYCRINRCSSSDYNLNNWGNLQCLVHNLNNCLNRSDECSCKPPYHLYTILTKAKNPVMRKKWLHLINRAEKSASNKLWIPGKAARVCSKHFIDGYLTGEHPYPTENLGYDSKRKVNIVTNSSLNPRRKKVKVSQSIAADSSIDHDHSYFSSSSSAYVEDDTQSSLLEEYQETNVNVRGIFVKCLHVFMYLFAFMLSSTILNFIYGFALSCRRKLAFKFYVLKLWVCKKKMEGWRDTGKEREIVQMQVVFVWAIDKKWLCFILHWDPQCEHFSKVARVYCTVCSSSVEGEKGNIY